MQIPTRATWRNLAATLAVLVLTSPAFAALPTVTLPEGVNANDPIAVLTAVARIVIGVAVLVTGAIWFWQVASGALNKWRLYREGRAEAVEIKEYFLWGALALTVVVVLLTIASSVI